MTERTETTLYLVRHYTAAGQEPEAPLTREGLHQAQALAEFLAPLAPEAILASPWRRTRETASPLARHLGLTVATDERLTERVLKHFDPRFGFPTGNG